MIGAIIGDIVGSRWEFNPIKSKSFEFLTKENFLTDDSYMTLAIAKSFMECRADYSNLGEVAIRNMREIGYKYPDGGYGERFSQWLISNNPQPYNSFGNGAAMRVSPCGIVADSIEEAKMLSRKVTEVTHNHPEGIKGAEAVAVAVFLARNGKSKSEIIEYIDKNYYPMNFSLKDIRDTYEFDETCQGSVPQAFKCLDEAQSFKDCLRNAVSLGGDADTMAAIAGSIAEYCYDASPFRGRAMRLLPKELLDILTAFEMRFEKRRAILKNNDLYNKLYEVFKNYEKILPELLYKYRDSECKVHLEEARRHLGIANKHLKRLHFYLPELRSRGL